MAMLFHMKVAEKDNAVNSLLEEEYQRCRSVLSSLVEKAEQYPKGSIHVRKKIYKEREYAYYCLVAREHGKVVNRHIPHKELPHLRVQFKERDSYRKEIQVYRKRIAYLERLLQKSRGMGKPKK